MDLNLNISCINLLNDIDSLDFFEKLEEKIIYQNDPKVFIFNKFLSIKRKQQGYGDENISYTFNKCKVVALPWLPELLQLRDLIYEKTNYKYNFVLVNRYQNNSDYIGFHRDDEKELDDVIPIASLSLGDSRKFKMKRTKMIGPLKVDLNADMELKSGMLLMFDKKTNKYWYHSLPKTSVSKNVRLNLTFRSIM